MTTHGRYPGVTVPRGVTRPIGHRLSDHRDPAVQYALGRTCPACNAEPDVWCVGISETEGSRTRGRRLTRIHVARAAFKEYGANGLPTGGVT